MFWLITWAVLSLGFFLWGIGEDDAPHPLIVLVQSVVGVAVLLLVLIVLVDTGAIYNMSGQR